MRVLRGRAIDIETDRAATRAMAERVATTDEPALRVWRPLRQVAFGRRDTIEEGDDRACERAESRGYPTAERRVDGRAVAYTGPTVTFARSEPTADLRTRLGERYEAVTTDLQVALQRLDVRAWPGETPESFCPGSHSLRAEGKVAGIAQRVSRDVALVAGAVVVDDHEAIADVLDPVYDALEVPFDPGSVGSIKRAGGETDPDTVLEEIEQALVERDGTESIAVESIREHDALDPDAG